MPVSTIFNEGICSWYDFATEIVQEAGLKSWVLPILSKRVSLWSSNHLSVLDKSKIKRKITV
jgi:dTDP-4-dehydrorhamnose reductase